MGRKAISDEAFSDQLKMNVRFVEDCFSKKPNKGFVPQFVAVTLDHKAVVMVIPDLPADSEERHKMMFDIGQKFQLNEQSFPVCIYMMSEAWMRGQTDKDEKVQLPIRDNPTKTECVVITGMTVDNRTNMAMLPMLRGTNGVVILKKPEVYEYEDGKEGMVALLLQQFYRGYFSEMKKGE